MPVFRLYWDMLQSSMNSETSDYKWTECNNVELEINYYTPISEGVNVVVAGSRGLAGH